jgi:hypothetical protein
MIFKNLFWALFLLRKKPGFGGVPTQHRAAERPCVAPAPRPSNPLRESWHPKGWT